MIDSLSPEKDALCVVTASSRVKAMFFSPASSQTMLESGQISDVECAFAPLRLYPRYVRLILHEENWLSLTIRDRPSEFNYAAWEEHGRFFLGALYWGCCSNGDEHGSQAKSSEEAVVDASGSPAEVLRCQSGRGFSHTGI